MGCPYDVGIIFRNNISSIFYSHIYSLSIGKICFTPMPFESNFRNPLAVTVVAQSRVVILNITLVEIRKPKKKKVG